MSKQADDLEAVRSVIAALEPFDHKDRGRIIRWACEKLGMTIPVESVASAAPPPVPSALPTPPKATESNANTPQGGLASDIKSFIAKKSPKGDNHLAATVAYFYQFEAPAAERKESIDKDDLIDACRRADRKRPARPAQVLVNAYLGGLLDRGERGQYRLNSVGENLVAMVLPDGGMAAGAPGVRRSKGKPSKAPRKRRASQGKQ
jgi:hypothetical protein